MTKRLAEVIASGFGSGLGPKAPATWGSAAALLVYWALPFEGRGDSPWFFVLIGVTLFVGTSAANAIITPADKDPKRCVIDEWLGVWATCLFLPATWYWLLGAFVVFRALDIAKPLGIRQLERLPGGIGVMADDLAAGLLGALILNGVRIAVA